MAIRFSSPLLSAPCNDIERGAEKKSLIRISSCTFEKFFLAIANICANFSALGFYKQAETAEEK